MPSQKQTKESLDSDSGLQRQIRQNYSFVLSDLAHSGSEDRADFLLIQTFLHAILIELWLI